MYNSTFCVQTANPYYIAENTLVSFRQCFIYFMQYACKRIINVDENLSISLQEATFSYCLRS